MEGLKEWALAVAVIVIFAALLEMLVPAGGTKRYVQLAMGLLILLTLLQPVISVLQHTRNLVWETEAAWQAPDLALSSVLAQADRIRQGSQERQVKLYQTRLEESAARQAESVLGRRRVTAWVSLGKPPAEGGPPPIESIILEVGPDSVGGSNGGGTLAAGAAGAAGPGAASVQAIEPVQPVEIQIGAKPAAPPPEQPGLDPALAHQAQRAVAELLQVTENRITVRSKS
ncbi:MAG: stage III sporulation protein AF [Symbiobacteriia bacterium]